jgi:hypothetical protein
MRLNRYTRPVGNCLLDLPRDISAHESSLPLSHAVVPARPGSGVSVDERFGVCRE